MRRLTMRSTAVLLVALSAAASETFAQTVPYKTSGTGIYSPVTGDYSGSGVGTHMGKHTFSANIAVFPTADPLVFDFASTSPQTTIAANGDTILFTSTGSVQLIPLDTTFTTFTATWTGEFTAVGGTGRFANVRPAAQPLHAVATNDPFTFADPEWSFSWTLDGSIVLH